MPRTILRNLPQVFAGTLLLIGIIAFSLTATYTYAGSKKLTVGLFGQEQSNWCWAAANKMIMSYHGTSASQCSIVSKVFPSCPNNAATLNQVESSLHAYSFNTWLVAPLGAAEVVNEINASRPFWVRWQWAAGGGHAVVVYGYDSDANNSATWVYYNNPLPQNVGARESSSYARFKDDGVHFWTDTIWNIHK